MVICRMIATPIAEVVDDGFWRKRLNTLRNRIISAVVGVGFAVMAAFAPSAAQAAVPATGNVYQDASQVAATIHESFFIQAVATVCAQRVTDYQLQNLCYAIEQREEAIVHNGRLAMFYITGLWPNNPALTAAEQFDLGVIENVKIDFVSTGNTGEEELVGDITFLLLDGGPSDLSPGVKLNIHGAFSIVDYLSSRCAEHAYSRMAQHYCATLNYAEAQLANELENYITFTYGTPFTPPGPPNPFQF
jgi:hypothetical protein